MEKINRTADKIERIRLSDAYLDNMSLYLSKTFDIPINEARVFVSDQMKSKVKLPKIDVIETVKPGRIEKRSYGFSDFLTKIHDNVISPSGSVYVPSYVKTSITTSFIKSLKHARKVVKDEMLALKAKKQHAASKIKKFIQNSIKVTLNSLPGAAGYLASIFGDKGTYNAITSGGRMLISNSFICCEQFLGGNLLLHNIEEAVNLLVLIDLYGPSDDVITQALNKYNLKMVTRNDVLEYFNNAIKQHQLDEDLNNSKAFITLLNKLTPEKIQFAWYHSNMQHIVFENDSLFRTKIKNLFDTSNIVSVDDCSKEAFYKMDMDQMAIATTILASELNNIQTNDLPKHPELCARVMGCCKKVEQMQSEFRLLFDTFIMHDIRFQRPLSRNVSKRKAVVVSDTDSVIFTVMEWSNWFTKQKDIFTKDSYAMSAIATYWFNFANADTMAKFAIALGATKDDIQIIKMKSEFMYVSMLLYDIKKVYAALMKAQEGVIFDELIPDLKGSAIRGVGASPKARKFVTNMLVKEILEPVIESYVSATDLINKVTKFEQQIKNSIKSGKTDFFPIISVKLMNSYKNPDSSVYYYARAWNEIFGNKYDRVQPPNKLPLIKILEPTDQYMEWLKGKYPDTYEKFKQFINNNKKVPTAFFLPPTLKRIPKELLPIVNVRDITYFNVSPLYLTLESINIGVGYSDRHVLLSDIYSEM